MICSNQNHTKIRNQQYFHCVCYCPALTNNDDWYSV